jgi:hypothetical protein
VKRYDQFGYDSGLFPCKDGEWVFYDEVEEIAKRLETLKLFLREDPKYVYEQLTAIVNEIRGTNEH